MGEKSYMLMQLTLLNPFHRNLSSWANNGVLMLNTCLTVQAGNAGSHSNKGWEQFTDKVIDVVDRYGGANLPNSENGGSDSGVGRGVVFLAWGSWAAKRVAKLNKVSWAVHSSPLLTGLIPNR
jgi:uracil-DNA glycosylase